MSDETAKYAPHETSVSYVMAGVLKRNGMPIAALAEVLDVERSRLYGLIDRGEALPEVAASRLADVYAALHDDTGGPLKFLVRIWDRELPGGSLRSHLTAPLIDQASVAVALDALRPAAMRAMHQEDERKARPERETSPAGHLTMHLEAGSWPGWRT